MKSASDNRWGTAMTVLALAAALAVGAFLLQWLEYRYLVRQLDINVYLTLVAVGFALLGVWVGKQLTRTPPSPVPPPIEVAQNLGITRREGEVLTFLAEGMTNKQIARALGMSPNTVKTHLSKLFEKLEVQRRTQAVLRARELSLLP